MTATDSADLRQTWWLMAEVCAVGDIRQTETWILIPQDKALGVLSHCVFNN